MEDTLQDRIPPHSIEAEQSVLGSIFLDPETVVNVLEYLESSDFYRKNHQIIFDAILQLNNRNEAIDVVTISNELDTKNQLENAGGMEYLAELAVAVPTSANVEYYAKIVEEKSILRNLIRSATEIVRKGYEEGDELAVMLDSAEQNILQVSERRNRSGFIRISDVVSASLQNIESLAQRSDDVTGVPTGYIALDKMTAGLQKEELIILAARPAVGKTAFALNIAQNVATKADQVVAIFSLEMGAESLVNRMLCAEGNIDAGHLRTGLILLWVYQ